MKELRKIAAVGGAISLALCWPLAVGQIGKNVITDGVKHLNSASIQAEVVEYDRSYFSSRVLTRYQVTDPVLIEQLEADGLPSEFLVKSEVEHGLVSLNAVSTIDGLEELPLTLTTTTQLNGNTEFSLDLESWNHQTAGEGAVSIAVAKSKITGSASVLGQLTYQLDIPSVQLNFANGEQVALSGISGDGDGKQAQGYWLGTQQYNIDTFVVNANNAQPMFSMDDSTYQFESSIDDKTQRLSSKVLLDISKMMTVDGVVNDLNVDFELAKLDIHSFEKIFELIQTNPELTEEDVQALLPAVDTLFAKGFDISMNKVSLKLGEGEFQSQWLMTVPEGTENVSQNPGALVPALTGNLNTYFSNELVTEYPFIQEGIDELIVMEMITQTDTGYEIKAELNDGNLVFENGQQVPVFALLMPALMGQAAK